MTKNSFCLLSAKRNHEQMFKQVNLIGFDINFIFGWSIIFIAMAIDHLDSNYFFEPIQQGMLYGTSDCT